MNCKYCQQLLDAGSTVCPACGKDNAEEAEQVSLPAEETQTPVEESPAQPEGKAGITMSPGKLTLLIGSVVVLTALIVALILNGTGLLNFTSGSQETLPAQEPAGETVPAATIPADGDPEDVTCKGSYTVSDDEVLASVDTVVATMGEHSLTNGQLQVFYWMQVQQFLGNYGSYAAYFGLDYTQPLDAQVCSLSDENMTWQQFFLANALEAWHNYQALAIESVNGGLVISDANREFIDSLPESLATEGGLQGYESADAYLAANLGAGCSLEDYLGYMELYYQGYAYFAEQYQNLMPNEEDTLAYYEENKAQYEEEGVTEDVFYADARHILVFPQGGTTDEDGETTYTEEEWEACRAAAQEILDTWQAGEANEESFAALANEKSEDPGSNTNGGLYEDMYVGQMVEPFETWCFDESRQYGDTGLVRTSYGYHVMFFVSREPAWKTYAHDDLLEERANAMVLSVMGSHPIEVRYEDIVLGFVDMGA